MAGPQCLRDAVQMGRLTLLCVAPSLDPSAAKAEGRDRTFKTQGQEPLHGLLRVSCPAGPGTGMAWAPLGSRVLRTSRQSTPEPRPSPSLGAPGSVAAPRPCSGRCPPLPRQHGLSPGTFCFQRPPGSQPRNQERNPSITGSISHPCPSPTKVPEPVPALCHLGRGLCALVPPLVPRDPPLPCRAE